jgi:hypothetical protein
METAGLPSAAPSVGRDARLSTNHELYLLFGGGLGVLAFGAEPKG